MTLGPISDSSKQDGISPSTVDREYISAVQRDQIPRWTAPLSAIRIKSVPQRRSVPTAHSCDEWLLDCIGPRWIAMGTVRLLVAVTWLCVAKPLFCHPAGIGGLARGGVRIQNIETAGKGTDFPHNTGRSPIKYGDRWLIWTGLSLSRQTVAKGAAISHCVPAVARTLPHKHTLR